MVFARHCTSRCQSLVQECFPILLLFVPILPLLVWVGNCSRVQWLDFPERVSRGIFDCTFGADSYSELFHGACVLSQHCPGRMFISRLFAVHSFLNSVTKISSCGSQASWKYWVYMTSESLRHVIILFLAGRKGIIHSICRDDVFSSLRFRKSS